MTAANPSNPSCDGRAFSGSAARPRQDEPTLEEILAGPIIRALMLADHADMEALTAMLRSAASRLRDRTRAGEAAPSVRRRPCLGRRPAEADLPDPPEISCDRLGADGGQS